MELGEGARRAVREYPEVLRELANADGAQDTPYDADTEVRPLLVEIDYGEPEIGYIRPSPNENNRFGLFRNIFGR